MIAAAAGSSPASAATAVLVGRPNSGKSSLYNRLTGGNARVGNYPGITVDVLESIVELPSGKRATIADLPGLHSIEATVDLETDEGVAKRFLEDLAKKQDGDAAGAGFVVVQVIDCTRLALGLRLTKELAAKYPLVLALTHKDVLLSEGRTVDVRALESALGVPVVLLSTRDAAARSDLLAKIDAKPTKASTVSFDPASLARDVLRDDRADDAALARRKITERLDAVLLQPLVGPVLFLLLMALVFALVFLVADPVTGALDNVVGAARGLLNGALKNGLVASFVADGVLGGAGTVLAFMPQIVILTVALELLEASGYLARGAFLVDRFLRLLGLSGRSFLPLLMGHACAIPAIGATRVVRDPRERLTTILVIPLMTCSARLPTYGLVLAAFFSHRSAFFRAGLFVTLYFAGILTGLVASSVLRRTATKGRNLPLVLEMPAYRMPQARVVAKKAASSAKRFLRDIGTNIVLASIALWVLLSIPMPGSTGSGIESSIAGTIGRAIEPLTRPAGFDWRIDVGLIGSFGARELMVATMGVVYGIEGAADDAAPLAQKLHDATDAAGNHVYDTRTGLALLAFFVLACQCMSTVAAIRRETGSWKWPAFVLAYTYVLAYAAAVLVYQVSGLVT